MAEGDDDAQRWSHEPSPLGAVALSVCESLLLVLEERGVLDQLEIDGLLEDVESAHRNHAAEGDDRSFHDSVADVVQEMRRGGNSVRLLRKLRSPPPA